MRVDEPPLSDPLHSNVELFGAVRGSGVKSAVSLTSAPGAHQWRALSLMHGVVAQ